MGNKMNVMTLLQSGLSASIFLSSLIPHVSWASHQQDRPSFVLTTQPPKADLSIYASYKPIKELLASEIIKAQMNKKMAGVDRQSQMSNIIVGLEQLSLSAKMTYEDAWQLFSALERQSCDIAQLGEATHNYLMNQFHWYGVDMYQELLVQIPGFQQRLKQTIKGIDHNPQFYRFLKKAFGKKITALTAGVVTKVKLKNCLADLYGTIEKRKTVQQEQARHNNVIQQGNDAKKNVYKAAPAEQIQQILEKYNPALVDEESPAYKRYKERCQEITGDVPQANDCGISEGAAALLTYLGSGEEIVEEFKGNSAQYRVHKESIGIINRAAALHNQCANNQQIKEIVENVARLGVALHEYSQNANVLEAYELADLCWDVLDCIDAAIEGIVDGIVNTVHIIRHPVTTASNVAEGLLAIVGGVAKVVIKLEEIRKLREKDDPLAQQKIDEAATSARILLHEIKNKILDIPARDIIKGMTTVGTEWFLFGRVLGMGSRLAQATVKEVQAVNGLSFAPNLESAAAGVQGGISLKATEIAEANATQQQAIKISTAFEENQAVVYQSNKDVLKTNWDELMRDPAHGNVIGEKSIQEAAVGIAAEQRGFLKGPLKRCADPGAEFVDIKGCRWDVKTGISRAKNGKYIFDAESFLKSVKKELALNENIILDFTKLDMQDLIDVVRKIKTELNLVEQNRMIAVLNRELWNKLN